MTAPQSIPNISKQILHIDSTFAPLVPKFLVNRKNEVAAIQHAVALEDFETIRKLAHGMKGAGGSYGFDTITEIGATLEKAAKERDSEKIIHGLEMLAIYLEQVEVVFY